jgi:hypothetical protein
MKLCNYVTKQSWWQNASTDENKISIMNNPPYSSQPQQPVQPISNLLHKLLNLLRKQHNKLHQLVKRPNTNSKLNLLQKNEKALLDVNKLQ